MKSEKGITLESLIIYIVVTILVIGILTKVSTTFYNNMQYIDGEGIFGVEYQKFQSNFIEDIKTVGMRTLEVDINQKYVLLYNENTKEQIKYTFLDTGIYRNEALISRNLKTTIKQDMAGESKNILSVLLEYTGRGGQNYTQTLYFYLP